MKTFWLNFLFNNCNKSEEHHRWAERASNPWLASCSQPGQLVQYWFSVSLWYHYNHLTYECWAHGTGPEIQCTLPSEGRGNTMRGKAQLALCAMDCSAFTKNVSCPHVSLPASASKHFTWSPLTVTPHTPRPHSHIQTFKNILSWCCDKLFSPSVILLFSSKILGYFHLFGASKK